MSSATLDRMNSVEEQPPVVVSMGVDKAAQSLGISKTAVFWLFKKKHLPSFKIGKRRLVRVSALEELAKKLESGEVVINLTEDRG